MFQGKKRTLKNLFPYFDPNFQQNYRFAFSFLLLLLVFFRNLARLGFKFLLPKQIINIIIFNSESIYGFGTEKRTQTAYHECIQNWIRLVCRATTQ